MKIGIDVSQTAFPETGVANFTLKLVENLLKRDKKNEYVLFFSSLRREFPASNFEFPTGSKVKIKKFRIPPTILDILWNRLHILPIEKLIGNVNVFISSDWTQPPSNAKKATILYDLIVYKYPQETGAKIVNVQKRKLAWVKKEVDKIICISESTKQDAKEILGIEDKKLVVIYPGM
jgi:glycosyltransferase involved in cell wall biosynthesis